jgi:hypothetical protein
MASHFRTHNTCIDDVFYTATGKNHHKNQLESRMTQGKCVYITLVCGMINEQKTHENITDGLMPDSEC